jgi:hypothetical protein
MTSIIIEKKILMAIIIITMIMKTLSMWKWRRKIM